MDPPPCRKPTNTPEGDNSALPLCRTSLHSQHISYISPEGLEDKSPVVGSLKVLLDISHCNHITLAGLNFRHSTSGGQEGPYAWGAESAVRLTHVEDVLLDDCEFSHLGMIGVYIQVVKASGTLSLI